MSTNSENSDGSSKTSQESPLRSGLSFFTADDNDTSSDSESDEEISRNDSARNGDDDPVISKENKLPSPSTLFATVGKPKFLEKPLEQNDIDWNSLARRYEPLFEYSSVSYPAETVDLSSDERNEASISGAPVKYKTEISETKRHVFLHGKRAVDLAGALQSSHSPSTDSQEGETSVKKQKTS